jgi:hypothetical protein
MPTSQKLPTSLARRTEGRAMCLPARSEFGFVAEGHSEGAARYGYQVRGALKGLEPGGRSPESNSGRTKVRLTKTLLLVLVSICSFMSMTNSGTIGTAEAVAAPAASWSIEAVAPTYLVPGKKYL